jgi:hypothetical protein
MCDTVRLGSVRPQDKWREDSYIRGSGIVISACTSIALYPPFQRLPSSRVVLRDRLRLLRLTLIRFVASGVSLPSPTPSTLVGGLLDVGATKELPKEGFSEVGLSLWRSLKKEGGRISR